MKRKIIGHHVTQLQEMLKKVLQAEEKWDLMETQIYKEE